MTTDNGTSRREQSGVMLEAGEHLTLVVGGTGKTGRRVAERLAARGQRIRLGSRGALPPFDWDEPATWEPALQGADAVYLTFAPDLAIPGAVAAVRDFVDLAEASGVRSLVLLSGRGEEEARQVERVVAGSRLAWTIVRASWFAQNFSENFFLDGILAGELVLPAGNVGEPFIDADDIADVAMAALTEKGHAGQIYEVTGPRLLTFAQATAEIAAATGREIRYEQVSPEAYTAALEAQDVPSDVIWLVNYLFTTVLDGRNAHLADGVQRALGRAPRDFADYARDAAATGAWAAPAAMAAR